MQIPDNHFKHCDRRTTHTDRPVARPRRSLRGRAVRDGRLRLAADRRRGQAQRPAFDASRRLATQPGRHDARSGPAAWRRNWSITGASTDRPEAKTTIATWFNPRALGGGRRPARNRAPAGAAGAALEPLKPPLVHHEQLQELHRRRMRRRRLHTTQHQPVGHDRHRCPPKSDATKVSFECEPTFDVHRRLAAVSLGPALGRPCRPNAIRRTWR